MYGAADASAPSMQAVDRPRLHHQWQPDEIFVERFGLSSDTQALLQDMGYRIREQDPCGAMSVAQDMTGLGSTRTVR